MQTLNFDENSASHAQAQSLSGVDDQTLVINRRLEQDQANLVIKCPPGKITLLQDSDTGCLLPYQNALAGLEEPGFSLSVGSNNYNHRQHALAGFTDKLPDESILAYLTRSGLNQTQVEIAVRRYEFGQYKYLTCAQLSQTTSRQVSLLSACSGAKNILVMNDPFQPFSGRWREHFAELLLQEAKEKNRTIVIVNLSFMPQVWNEDNAINVINVSKSHEKAAQLAKERKIREERLREQKRIEAEKARQAAEKNPSRTISFETTDGQKAEILDPSLSTYKAGRDFLFGPIAALSRVLRFFSGPALTYSLGIFLLIGALVMFPGIRNKWKAMSDLGAQMNVTKDIKEALLSRTNTNLTKTPNVVRVADKDDSSEQSLAQAVDNRPTVEARLSTVDRAQVVEKNPMLNEIKIKFAQQNKTNRPHFRSRYNQSYLSTRIRRINHADLTRAAAARSKILEMFEPSQSESEM
jgi:hypothetical protein